MHKSRKLLVFSLIISFVYSSSSFARRIKYPEIYPFIPFKTAEVHDAVRSISEDEHIIKNFFDIIDGNLSEAQSKSQPWTSTFWPMNKGMIADPYESSFIGYYVEMGTVSWTRNYSKFKKRQRTILKNIDRLTSKQLNFLAPSEKYDLLLGDKSFDLTNRMWDYMQKWGNYKEFGFLSNLDITGEKTLETAQMMVDNGWFKDIEDAFKNAYQLQGSLAVEEALRLVKDGKYDTIEDAMDEAVANAMEESSNYVLERRNQYIAFWEGLCHGWATSAGIVERPKHTVELELPDKRKMKFYPADIKALISLLWANSLIQDNKFVDQNTGKNIGGGVLYQGLRCNLSRVKKDAYGRLYDQEKDPFNGDHSPRCSGVHPAIWHLGLVNLIGKQGRSFIVERKVNEEVDNHPMHSYTMKYFHPNKGRSYKDVEKNIVEINRRDQFKAYRNPEAKYIIGVETKMVYLDWMRPIRYLNDHEGLDKLVKKKMYYDLELDEDYNIVGGQWRAKKTGKPSRDDRQLNHNQPDFFWAITKDWKPFFTELTDLEPWTDTTKAPPASWLSRAHKAHEFIYHKKYAFGNGAKCTVINKRTGKAREVSCEYEEPRPQPLINLVHKLLELSQ